ncbi:MAG: sodium:solute symporter [Bacteroidales bacterium]|nr:sodium:solute symporter [Bacteroidales bacterium]
MSPFLILSIFLTYSALLFIVGFLTSKKATNESFFIGNRQSPWYLVAYGMIGASLSGVTFISIPGSVGADGFSYMVIVLGYFFGYLTIINILLPVYYKLNVTSIYTYFEQRFGTNAYKSGASYFLLSRTIGAAFRMYLVIAILQAFVFKSYGIPLWVTAVLFIALILLYTFKAGIKTIVWTDTLQTTFMLAALFISLYLIMNKLQLNFSELSNRVFASEYSKTFLMDWQHPKFFLKQFISGVFISIVMTGMDQDMMQKNLTCRNLKESQKNMFWMSLSLIPINFIFLFLGATLFIFATHVGVPIPAKADHLFPTIAFGYLPPIAGITFMIGLIAAAYSSADSAMTALTTSFSVDILAINDKKNKNEKQKIRTRKLVHFGVAATLLLIIILFSFINKDSVINELFTVAGYTYGPILGLFSFGLLTKHSIKDQLVIPIVILAPVISLVLDHFSTVVFFGYKFGFEILLINGLLTFIGLWLIKKDKTE